MNGAWTADDTMTLKLLRCDKGTVVLHSVPGAHEMCVGVFWVRGKHEDVCDLYHLSEQMSVCLRQQASQGAKSSVSGSLPGLGASHIRDTILAGDLSV